jgi:hypothetical protein
VLFADIVAGDQSPLDAVDNDMVEHAFGVETHRRHRRPLTEDNFSSRRSRMYGCLLSQRWGAAKSLLDAKSSTSQISIPSVDPNLWP